MTQRMSITQALAELKLLRSRIDSSHDGIQFVALKTKRNEIDTEAFSKRARSAVQSFNDLMARHNRIKSRIVQSNATTRVKIAGTEYTVAEAVEYKRMISYKTDMLSKLKSQYTQAKAQYDAEQKALQERLDRLLLQELGKESRTNVEVVNNFSDTFMKNNRPELIDPLKLADYVREQEKEIEEFRTNVDWVLSESNGTTFIEV